MQEAPDPLAQLLSQLTDLGVAVVMPGRRQAAVPHGQPLRPAPALAPSLAIVVTLPAASTARPVVVPCPANDNAEG